MRIGGRPYWGGNTRSRLLGRAVLLCAFVLVTACAGDGGDATATTPEGTTAATTTPVVETTAASTAPEPASTSTSTSAPIGLPPQIMGLAVETGALCSGATTTVRVVVSDPDGLPLTYAWSAEYGQVVGAGLEAEYTAPLQIPSPPVDWVTVEVGNDTDTVVHETAILLAEPGAGTEWEQTNGPEGGYMTSIEIDSADPDVLYLGGAGGGLFKSLDGGETWDALPQFLEPGQVIRQLHLDPAQPGRVYASTGAVYRSDDGGDTFEMVLGVPAGVSQLAISTSDPGTLVAGTWDGRVLRTTDGGDSWSDLGFPTPPNSSVATVAVASTDEIWAGTREWSDNADGQLFHTIDGGSTWILIDNMDQAPDSDIQSILIDPLDPAIVYVGLMQSYNAFLGSDARAALRTEDGGGSWSALPLPQIYVSAINLMGVTSYDRTLYVGIGGSLFKSMDGGTSLLQLPLPGRNGDISDLASDPRDPSVVFLPTKSAGVLMTENGGLTFEGRNSGIKATSISLLEVASEAGPGTVFATSAGGEGQFRSFDFGESWERVTDNGITHPWADEIQINPHDADEVWYVADIGRVQVSPDRGDSWRTVIDTEGSGFRFGSVYALALAPSSQARIYALKNGFGIFRFNDWWAGAEVAFLHRSEVDYSFSLAVHPEDEDLVVGGTIPKPFQSSAMVRVSGDAGDSWQTLLEVEHSAGVTSVAFSPVAPYRLYAASTGTQPMLYRFDDVDAAAVPMAAPAEFTGQIDYIELVPHPTDPDTLFMSAYPAGIFSSDDAGRSWARIDQGLPAHQVEDALRQGRYNLTVSASNPDVLYVGLFGRGVYRTTDRGSSWLATSTPANDRILALTVDPTDDEIVIAGTETGAYRSDTAGESWAEFSTGMEGIGVRSLAWGSNRALYAGTLGYELFFVDPGGDHWGQLPPFGWFGTFWPIWNDRPLYQYTFLSFDPTDPDTIVLGTFPAGIYVSTDGGQTWRESNTNWSWDGVFSLAYHPDDPDILFAGTYNGLNRSLDGGRTWEMWDEGWPDEQWTFSIDFDPGDATVMYAAAKNGENEGKGQPGFFMGSVMKSTDGGEHWFEIMNGLPRDQEYYAIIVDRFTPEVVYLASQGNGVYLSRDGGAHWRTWNEGLTNTVAGTNGNNVTNMMALSPDGTQLYFASAGSGVFRRMTVNAGEVMGCEEP